MLLNHQGEEGAKQNTFFDEQTENIVETHRVTLVLNSAELGLDFFGEDRRNEIRL